MKSCNLNSRSLNKRSNNFKLRVLCQTFFRSKRNSTRTTKPRTPWRRSRSTLSLNTSTLCHHLILTVVETKARQNAHSSWVAPVLSAMKGLQLASRRVIVHIEYSLWAVWPVHSRRSTEKCAKRSLQMRRRKSGWWSCHRCRSKRWSLLKHVIHLLQIDPPLLASWISLLYKNWNTTIPNSTKD